MTLDDLIFEAQYRAQQTYYRLQHIARFPGWLWGYFKFLCKNRGDYDYDYDFFLALMKWKLGRMANEIERNDIIAGSEEVVKSIRYTVELIDLVKDPEKIYDKILVDFRARHPSADAVYGDLQVAKEYRELLDAGAYAEKLTRDLLFQHMSENITSCWY